MGFAAFPPIIKMKYLHLRKDENARRGRQGNQKRLSLSLHMSCYLSQTTWTLLMQVKC